MTCRAFPEARMTCIPARSSACIDRTAEHESLSDLRVIVPSMSVATALTFNEIPSLSAKSLQGRELNTRVYKESLPR